MQYNKSILFTAHISVNICLCDIIGHPSCLHFSPSLTERVRQTRWQCLNCKSCTVCGGMGQAVGDASVCCGVPSLLGSLH